MENKKKRKTLVILIFLLLLLLLCGGLFAFHKSNQSLPLVPDLDSNAVDWVGKQGHFHKFPGQRVLNVFPFVYVFFGFCH